MTQTVTSQPMKRVEDWKSRLIDLSKRNNLLYFHKAKRGSLPISQPDLQAIFNALVLKKRRLEFWMPPEENKTPEQTEKPKNKGKTKAKTAKTNVKAAVKPDINPACRKNQNTPNRKSTCQRKLSRCRSRKNLKVFSGVHFSIIEKEAFAFCMQLSAP